MFKIKVSIRNSFFIFLSVPIVFFICIIIISRNPELPDYNSYYMVFNSIVIRKEIEMTYTLFSNLFIKYQDGFYYVLFIYAIFGFGLKYYFGYKYIWKEKRNTFFYLFLISYSCGFMILWDFIQIRASAGISFFMLGVMCDKKIKKTILLFLSFLFHYSMIMPICAYLVFRFVKNNYHKIWLVPLMVISAILMLMLSSYSQSYGKFSYNIESRPLYSTVYALLYLMVVVIFYFRNSLEYYKENIVPVFFTGLTILIIAMTLNSNYPALSDRFIDISGFCLFLCLFFIKTNTDLQRLFLIFFIIFISLMRLRIMLNILDVPLYVNGLII